MHDPGVLVVMVRNEASADAIGYVEVRYKIRFSDFHLEPSSAPSSRFHALVGLSGIQTVTTATAEVVAFDTTIAGAMGHSFTAGAVNLSPGMYRINVIIRWANTANEPTNCSATLQTIGTNSGTITQDSIAQSDAANTGGMYKNSTMLAIVVLNEDFVAKVTATVTGATGTLTLFEECRMLIEAIM
jgi:hypothetical protein